MPHIDIQSPWRDDTSPEDIKSVLVSVAEEFDKLTETSFPNAIQVCYSDDGPLLCNKVLPGDGRIVLLKATSRHWAQFAFQFAHEYCHILTQAHKSYAYARLGYRFLWFEEALCELASWCVLQKMARTWRSNPPYSNWASYSTALQKYATNRIDETPAIGVAPSWFLQNLCALLDDYPRAYEDSTHERVARIRGCVLAKLLYDLSADENFWPAVVKINTWSNICQPDFQSFLNQWCTVLNDEEIKIVQTIRMILIGNQAT